METEIALLLAAFAAVTLLLHFATNSRYGYWGDELYFLACGERLHVHQLIAKIPRSRRWQVSLNERRVMAAAVKRHEVAYPGAHAEAG